MGKLPGELPSRVAIEGVSPEVDSGRFPIKRCVGDSVRVEADIFCDGHEVLAAVLKYRPADSVDWSELPLRLTANDRWTCEFPITALAPYEYTIEAWIDRFATWRRDLSRKLDAGQDVGSELLEGAELVRETAPRAGADGDWLKTRAEWLASSADAGQRSAAALDAALLALMSRHADRTRGRRYERTLRVLVECERARFGAWYEFFPRSTTTQAGRHGTLRDAMQRLDYVAGMGFDVLYFPPIHPIGRSHRKGPNNTLQAGPSDTGSPWAIGSSEGGHTAIHPDLGTLDDFDRLVAEAGERKIEIALDIAFQCSPDHPWVREHPEWFRHRPDGTIKYAENPPKKYQDIYPLDFECDDWRGLWSALRDVVLFWRRRGVKIFRVDNPHTKPFPFWEWMIAEVRQSFPDATFLSEAFTRPKVMKHLAKCGFSQSYTYFTWRNTKREIVEYFTELTQTDVREYMRPNLFANTPDILPEYLQYGGPAAFRTRFILAATLGATYGIYGPPFESFQDQPVKPHSEEYLDSEKYQVRQWDWEKPNVFTEFIARVNRVRRDNPALHRDDSLRFYRTDNDQIICYAKSTSDRENTIVCVVNLDPHHVQSGFVTLPLEELGIRPGETYQLHDLLTDARFLWQGESNYVQLDPRGVSAHVLRLRKRIRSEQDFDYFG